MLTTLPEKGRALLDRLTRRSSSSFKFAFLFLGPEQRSALERVYGFCRIVDDIVDERPPGAEGVAQARAGLDRWRDEVARVYAATRGPDASPVTELGRGLAESVRRFDLPRRPFEEIIEGCAMDLELERYADAEQLELYCYRVASCVGLIAVGIFGDQGEAAQVYARHLGLALQYTNILRDVAEDAVRGRIYLPQSMLARHGLTDEDIMRSVYDARFIALAREFDAMAQREYEAAWSHFDQVEHRRALLPAEIMGRTYYEILLDIRSRKYDVFSRRPTLRRRDKLRVAAMSIARTSLPAAASLI